MATQLFSRSWLILLLVAALSSFTIVISAEDTSKSDEQADVTTSDDSNSQEDSKEKRSQEEIMFGNQQNKPNGLVDDLMSMSENVDDNATGSQAQDLKSDEEDEKQSNGLDENQNQWKNMLMGSRDDDWYNAMPASNRALQYISDGQQAYKDLEEVYRRKRQLLERPHHLRSLRSPLGQMIQKRGIRMPRRSMRLKRQVDVEDLLNLFGNEHYYNEEVTPHSFSGRARIVSKRHQVPGRFSGYQETPEYRYPYVFQHRDDGILSPTKNDESSMDNESVDDLLLLPPNSRYIDTPQDMDLLPYRTHEEDNDGVQKWLSRHTVPSVVPSVFRVSRRSSPFFYPVDYRYMPGYKKRSGGNVRSGRFSDEEPEGDFGKWGHVVKVPEAYASPEDIARLYGLANLLSEEDEVRMRRST